MTPSPRFNVLGVGVHALTLDDARDRIVAAAREIPSRIVCCCDVNSVCSARRDARHRAILNRAFLTTPDGMPLVWLGQRDGHPKTTRVYGPDLLLAVAAATQATGHRHYFCGARPGTADLLAATLRNRFPISKEDQTDLTILEENKEDEKHYTRPQTGDTFLKNQ